MKPDSPAVSSPVARSPVSGVALNLRGVGRTFAGGVRALEPIDLTVPAGQFLSLLGPSGCGKSTLLRMIAGLDRPTTGQMNLPDASVAYVFQDATLLPWRNVLRNVTLPLELRGVSRQQRESRALHSLSQVGLTDAAKRYPAQLSGGMRMRVSLARALITDPTLLLLDEPFAALDEITRQHLDDQLRTLWLKRGMTVIFVTHSTAEAVFLADRTVVLSARPGRIVLDQRIDLPIERDTATRSTPAFGLHTALLFNSLLSSSPLITSPPLTSPLRGGA